MATDLFIIFPRSHSAAAGQRLDERDQRVSLFDGLSTSCLEMNSQPSASIARSMTMDDRIQILRNEAILARLVS